MIDTLTNRIHSFGGKLLLFAATTTGLAVLLVCATLIARDLTTMKSDIARSLTTQAQIIGVNSTAAIAFDDPTAGEETLAALEAVPEIVAAGIYRTDGSLFATYGEAIKLESPDRRPHGYEIRDGHMHLVHPIEFEGRRQATLMLCYDMGPAMTGIRAQAGLAVLLGCLALGLAMLLANQLRRALARPVGDLVATAREVSAEQNYKLRAPKQTNDEIGELADAFNEMLSLIETRSAELEESNQSLERRVHERTAELERSKERAEAASRAKTHFLANMSHEIRTPMTAILGFSDLLQDPSMSASERLEYVQTIRRNGQHLLGIINDILDLSKIEAGKMTVELVEADLPQLVADVSSLMRMRAGERGLDFAVDYRGSIPAAIRTDPTRLRQILMNLLGNAVKFTQQGSVRLVVQMECWPLENEDAAPHICFDVVDTGIGISEEKVQNLFRAFSQADETMTRRFGGTGLGLAISKQLAQLLGGDIAVVSSPGRGSTFTVRVGTGCLRNVEMLTNVRESDLEPDGEPVYEANAASESLAAEGVRVLLAEDGPDNQRLITHVLRKFGCVVTLAPNGRIALEKALEARDAGNPFEVILMDMQMPELDGYQATTKLRDADYDGPIIALTAHAMSGDRERCIRAGCDDYATKPIDRNKLRALILKYAEVDESTESPVEEAGTPSSAPSGSTTTSSGLEPLLSEFADEEDMVELIDGFLGELPDRLYKLDQAAREADLAVIASLAHQLKGAAGGYGFTPITEASRSLEQRAKSGDPIEEVRDAVAELRKLCQRAVNGRSQQQSGARS
ncbi:MAG: ATP-binding protein [Phycisphaerales bacterium]